MRIATLRFPAFGPFTDHEIELNPNVGFHLFYGPNEAGKSSMLRGIRSLFFGIENRTSDDFLHNKPDLRIGARLLHSDGNELDVYRRKGRGDTLLTPHGEQLSDAILAPYLGGVDQPLFERLYGLDHNTLVEGGKALLEGQGDVGQSLFAAGLGPEVRALTRKLKDEASELWRERGQVYPLNQALASFKNAQKELTQKTLSPQKWIDLSREIAAIDGELEKLLDDLQEAEREGQRLERCSRAVPLVAERKSLHQQFQSVSVAPDLPPDFSERRSATETRRAEITSRLTKLNKNLNETKQTLATLQLDPRLLHRKEQIDQLYRGLDGYLKLGRDIQESSKNLAMTRQRISSLSSDLYPEAPPEEITIPPAGVRLLSSKIASEFQAASGELELCEKQRQKKLQAAEALQARLKELGEPQSLSRLEALVARLTREVKLDDEVSELEQQMIVSARRVKQALACLPSFSADEEGLATIQPLLPESITRYKKRFTALEQQEREQNTELERLLSENRKLEKEQSELEGLTAPPTPSELVAQRAKRDEQREALSHKWRKGSDWEQAEQGWADYEKSALKADQIADALFHESERVVKIAGLQHRRDEGEALITKQKEALLSTQSEKNDLQKEWQGALPPSLESSLEPDEYAGWLRKRESILEDVAKRQELADTHEAKQKRRADILSEFQEIIAQLDAKLNRPVSSIELALRTLQDVLNPRREIETERSRLQDQKSALEPELAELEISQSQIKARLDKAQSQWQEILQQLNLNTVTDPQDLSGLLDKYEQLGKLLSEEKQNVITLEDLQLQQKDYEQRAEELAKELLGGWEKLSAQESTSQLYQQLQAAKDAQTRQDNLRQKCEELRLDIRDLEEKLETNQGIQSALLQQAGASSFDELPEIEAAARRKTELQAELSKREAALQELSAGASVDSFCSQVEELDPDTLPHLVNRSRDKIDELKARQGELRESLGDYRRQKQHLASDDMGALEASAQSEDAAAQIRELTEQYMILALSHHLLNQQMEEYRRTNQGPILDRAQRSFQQLTQGYYPRLETGFNEKTDQPVLRACDNQGRRVPVDGLSDGTRDQLFLALRLATIEQQLIHHEPVPFIADDLLVHFDSDRALAALQLLAEFSKKTQVLFFTHLERDRELARQLPEGVVEVHGLERALG